MKSKYLIGLFGFLTIMSLLSFAYLDFGKWLVVENAFLLLLFVVIDFIQEEKEANKRRQERRDSWK